MTLKDGKGDAGEVGVGGNVFSLRVDKYIPFTYVYFFFIMLTLHG
jgi:hypothetical protein